MSENNNSTPPVLSNSTLNDVLLAVIGLAQATNPYATIVIGSLPPDNGISMTYATGAVDTTFFNKSGISYDLSLVCNGKNTSAQTVSDALNAIHETLTTATDYPSTDKYQITNISTTGTPAYVGREQNSQILYGSGLRVRVYLKKG